MLKYEPYLEAAKRAKKKADRAKEKEEAESASGGGSSSAPSEDAKQAEPTDEGAGDKRRGHRQGRGGRDHRGRRGAPPVEEKPWWQQASDKSKPLKIKLSDLEEDSDSTIAKRMVKGFFVAVDKPFGWNGRGWYKTTGGLVAPSDRMVIIKPPTTQGSISPRA